MSADDEPLWLEKARLDLEAGVKETPGRGGTPRILEMYNHAGLEHSGDDTASWCGCAVGTWLKEAGFPVPKNFYGAKQFETYGRKVDPDEWQVGDIGVFYRTALRERDWKRHVGLIVGETATHYKLLGGNQRVKGSKLDGVTITTIPKKDCSAIRRPVAATVKDLRDAGSTEIKTSDDLVKVGVGTVATGVGGAIAKEATETTTQKVIEEIPVKEVIEYSDWTQQIMEGVYGVAKLVGKHPWLAVAILGGLGLFVLARRMRKGRVKRHAAGAEISSQATVEAG